jgi:hypothetical protein
MSRALLGKPCLAACLIGVALSGAAGCAGSVGSTTGAKPGAGGVSGGDGGVGPSSDPMAAGVRPLRLLSGREYLNTVRDLLGDTSLQDSALPTGDEDPLGTRRCFKPRPKV